MCATVEAAASCPLPVKKISAAPARTLAVGDEHACYIAAGGQLRCWGAATASNLLPQGLNFVGQVDQSFTSLSIKGSHQGLLTGTVTCAVTAQSQLHCLGTTAGTPPTLIGVVAVQVGLF